MILVHHLCSGYLLFLLLGTAVDMHLRTRTAGTRVAHLPEIVVLVAVDDMVLGQVLLPDGCCLVVALKTFFGASLEHRCIQILRIQFQYIHQILPSPGDGFLLEVVAETPVAEHLEHGVMVGIVSHLLKVVVLAADAQTFLRIGLAAGFWGGVTEDDILELVHTGIGEHQCRVVLDDHRCRRYNEVSFRLEELLKRLAYFVCCHDKMDFSAAKLQKKCQIDKKCCPSTFHYQLFFVHLHRVIT